MNVDFKIEWKFIIVELVVLFLCIIFIDVYMIVKHNSTTKKYYSGNFKGLVKELKRLQSVSNIFSKNPRNKNREMIFNTTCIFLASISLLNGDENGFILELNKVKNYIRNKNKKNQFELLFMKVYVNYQAQAKAVTEQLKAQLERLGEPQKQQMWGLSHGDYNQHNVLYSQGEWALLNFEKMSYDILVQDLANFMRKILEKYNWNTGLGIDFVDGILKN